MTYGPTVEEFVTAFRDAWRSVYPARERELMEVYNNRPVWSQLMCGEHTPLTQSGKPILQLTLERLRVESRQVEFDRERHKVDAFGRVRVSSERDDFTDFMNSVMVEVENEVERSHEEFWKLLHSRCPLKVLLTYEYYNYPNVEPEARKTFEKMYREATPILGRDSASYLLIIGGRKERSLTAPIEWRFRELNADGRFELVESSSQS